MLDNHAVVVLLVTGVSLLIVVVALIRRIRRARMAQLVREAINAAYQDVEFIRINYIPVHSDLATLRRFHAARAMFQEAQDCLAAGRYRRTIELAKQVSDTIRSLRSQLVCRKHPLPVPPSCRIVSSPDGLLWMGE